VTTMFLKIFKCTSSQVQNDEIMVLDTLRLSGNMAIECKEQSHVNWMVVAGFGIVFWSLGIPISLWLRLRSLRQVHHTTFEGNIVRSYGFLYRGFEAQYYYFESVLMLRRVIFLSMAWLPAASQELRAISLLLFCCLSFLVFLVVAPFEDRSGQGLDMLDLISNLFHIVLLFGWTCQQLARSNNVVDMDYLSRTVYYIPAFLLAWALLVYAGYLFLRETIWPLHNEPKLVPRRIRPQSNFKLVLRHPGPIGPQHAGSTLSFDDGCAHLPSAFDVADVGCSRPLQWVTDRGDRQLFLKIIGEATNLLLEMHLQSCGEVPRAISLPLFLLQLERLLTVCAGAALKHRLKAIYYEQERSRHNTMELIVSSLMTEASSVLQGTRRSLTANFQWHNPDWPFLQQERAAIERPVTMEEMQVALMEVEREIIADSEDPQQALLDSARCHLGLIAMVSETDRIFLDEEIGRTSRATNQSSQEACDQLGGEHEADSAPVAKEFEPEACVKEQSLDGESETGKSQNQPVGVQEQELKKQESLQTDGTTVFTDPLPSAIRPILPPLRMEAITGPRSMLPRPVFANAATFRSASSGETMTSANNSATFTEELDLQVTQSRNDIARLVSMLSPRTSSQISQFSHPIPSSQQRLQQQQQKSRWRDPREQDQQQRRWGRSSLPVVEDVVSDPAREGGVILDLDLLISRTDEVFKLAEQPGQSNPRSTTCGSSGGAGERPIPPRPSSATGRKHGGNLIDYSV